MSKKPILLGNTFPMTLVRRRVVITPQPLEELRRVLKECGYRSFWGHENTVEAAEAILGVTVRPGQVRPVVLLDKDGYPELDDKRFNECWILSPEYRPGYRPAVGEEVPVTYIRDWGVLRIKW